MLLIIKNANKWTRNRGGSVSPAVAAPVNALQIPVTAAVVPRIPNIPGLVPIAEMLLLVINRNTRITRCVRALR